MARVNCGTPRHAGRSDCALRHDAAVNVITCSPDGKTVLTASNDGTAKLWWMPEPLHGSIEEVASRVHLSTGMRLDENNVVNALISNTGWLPKGSYRANRISRQPRRIKS